MVKLYSRLIDEKAHQHEVINQVDAQEQGWEEHELEVGIDGLFYEVGFAPKEIIKSIEEQRLARENAYILRVDPITSHIQRLRDEFQTESVVKKIEELKEQRSLIIKSIKEEFPYPESENYVD